MNKAMQDDVARQESAGRLVAAEVLACASQLVHEIEREEAYELLSRPVYACPECEDEGLEGEACDKGCGSIDIPATYEETDPREAYEHWIVSEWLAGKLAEQGEITGELLGLTIWGRCCTGQAIKLDEVMQQIALEVGR